jgi:hypothetical protein
MKNYPCSSYEIGLAQDQLAQTANDPNLSITTTHSFPDQDWHNYKKSKHKSDFLAYWRVFGESDEEFSSRLAKAMKDGKITYSEMLKLTKPIVPQADPLNPAPEKEKTAPWE